MNVFDYLNSKRGSSLLGIYAAIAVILVVLLLSVVMCWRHDWTDIPPVIGGMFLYIITAALVSHITEQKLTAPQPPPVTPPEPPTPPV